jgi:single-strand DNA-binding protein
MNKVILIGRLTKDPDLRTINNDISVCRFTLAVNRPYTKGKEQEADFFNIVAWRNQADNCGKYLTKGSQCAVEGTIQNRTYEKDGEKKYVTEIMAEHVEFLGSKEKTEQKQQSFKDLPNADDDDDLPF